MSIQLKGNDNSSFSDDVEIGGGKVSLKADGTGTFDDKIIVSNWDNDGTPGLRISSEFSNSGRILLKGDGSSGNSDLAISVLKDGNGETDAVYSVLANGTTKIGGALPSSPNIELGADGAIRLPQGYIDFRSPGTECDINASGDTLILRSGSNGVRLVPGATSWTAYVSESRLKNILGDVDAKQAWDLVKNIELKRYQYKDQDLQSVSYAGPMADWLGIQDPELLIDTGHSDKEGPIHTFNQGLLDVKALQALSTALTRIEALEAEVQELKGGQS